MNNWYMHYQNETRRRQEEIKMAENYRMVKNDPSASPATSQDHPHRFTALVAKMVNWGSKLLAHQGDLVITQDGNSL